ncbi:hypothetical protein QBC37DRAFT_153098 [Rhypophila decipiens]|uniref:CipC-like antibiotic response protein n=1 Tax=Rhypophila decipiens TaxID=261697 RepID=A0AAN7BFC9_9PEZI|nr:hypothetical protein QBC37DRAFT_153098 [Rhypophila decipiens]
MGFLDFAQAKDARDLVYNTPTDELTPEHKAKVSHELLGGAAAFEAMHVWEQEQRKEGKPVKHGLAKEALAALAAAEVDKVAESKGLDFVDREKAKTHASQQAESLYDAHYGDKEVYDPTEHEIHETMRHQEPVQEL